MGTKFWLAFGLLLAATPLQAAQLRVTCYADGNECEVLRQLAGGFTAEHPATTVAVDQVPYKTILESLPVQLAAGNGPRGSPTSGRWRRICSAVCECEPVRAGE